MTSCFTWELVTGNWEQLYCAKLPVTCYLLPVTSSQFPVPCSQFPVPCYPLNSPRIGWYLYDWANSAFSASVVTVFLGPYLASVAKAAADANGQISPFGITMHPGAFFSFAVSASVLLQVIVLPIIGALTDRTTLKRRMLGTMAFIGSLATTLLFFVTAEDGNYLLGGGLFVIANLAFGASMVVANAFLPILASPDERDKVSSRGWALGYFGGGLLLLIHLLYFQHVEAMNGPTGYAVRIILSSAGIWWALFTLAPLTMLPKTVATPLADDGAPNIGRSFAQLWHTLKSLRAFPMTLLFFVAYLLYNDAVQTVISMASVYGQEELHLDMGVLTTAILIVQFVAVGGSLLFERIARIITTKRAIV
ncbi:MAG: MFS transporter, partial [Ignavibacteriae bacterium]